MAASRVALALVLALPFAACGDDDDDSSSRGPASPPVVAVEDVASRDGEVVVLEGLLLAAPEAPHRLCAALAESYPPQCGGERVELVGLELAALDGTSTNEELPEGERTIWTDGAIRLVGTVDGDRFVLARAAEDVDGAFVVAHALAGGRPVVDAAVELWGPDDAVLTARTDELGTVVFPAPAGDLRVVPLSAGGRTAPDPVAARAGDTVTLAYHLNRGGLWVSQAHNPRQFRVVGPCRGASGGRTLDEEVVT
jgi:hypothetical protein